MKQPAITAVAGPSGVGKTTWIRQQLALCESPVLYFSPGTGNVPIDLTCIAASEPQVKTFVDGQESQFLEDLANGTSAYIEVGFYLDRNSLSEFLDSCACHRVAIVPSTTEDSEWQQWADEFVVGAVVDEAHAATQIWRSPLTGEVLDPASLDVFWYELTRGAYGAVSRAKGIFEVWDGRAFYFSFVPCLPDSLYEELPLPQWIEGRPQRFSGIEIIGQNLEIEAIGQTLQDCCLSDAAIYHYQQQLAANLKLSEEAIA